MTAGDGALTRSSRPLGSTRPGAAAAQAGSVPDLRGLDADDGRSGGQNAKEKQGGANRTTDNAENKLG